MYDKILRWYIEGGISRTKTEVGGTFTLDGDYSPDSVVLTDRIAGTGNPLTIDITADDISIFTDNPALPTGVKSKMWTTVEPNPIREGVTMRLNITGVPEQTTAQDLTVELRMKLV
jgi:hypothetical protein